VGHRLSGSKAADNAVEWGISVLQKIGLDKVYKQEIMVPFWERGDVERATLLGDEAVILQIATLGGSVSSNGVIEAEIIEVHQLADLINMGDQVKGKIVFFNRPMNPKNISTFEAYGGCVDQRYWGAVEASKAGAIAVLVRSMTLLVDNEFPHTGSMGYSDSVKKIPSVAVSTKHANLLHERLTIGVVRVALEVNPRLNEQKKSYNVIGEITGKLYPDQVILVGGHLDSWDLGEGAHDDGAGVVHSIEVLRILKEMNYKPNYTIRAVLFMNEENGNMGGKSYAKIAFEKQEKHKVAIESDRGGFSPRGFSLHGDTSQLSFLRSFSDQFKPYQLQHFELGYGGVDIGPLGIGQNFVNEDLFSIGLVPDSQRYFDFHHSADDVFGNVNRRELELGCAAMTSLVYMFDQHLTQTVD